MNASRNFGMVCFYFASLSKVTFGESENKK